MGKSNPGRFRREGREAFEFSVDPEDVCPYMSDSFWDKSHRGHWLEGWNEAKNSHIEEVKQTEYWITAYYQDGSEEIIYDVDFERHFDTCDDMPLELEINGVMYKAEF